MIRSLPILLLWLLAALPATAEPPAPAKRSEPIDITSDRLEADDATKQIRFLGQVVARQADVTLYAREMRVFLQPQGQEIERIEALGEVRIVQGEKVATADKGVLENREGKIILTGAPKVHQGKDFVTGDEITLYLHEEKSAVRSLGESRVRATFHPKTEAR